MSSIIEENGKALGKAMNDIGNAFCGAIVSITKDIETLGKDTIKAAFLENEAEKLNKSG